MSNPESKSPVLISQDYKQLNNQLHETNSSYGTSGKHYGGMVLGLIQAMGGTATVLDYGCGKQTLANSLPMIPVTGYDPCLPGLDARPEPHELVVCTDVMEHIEPVFLDNVLDDLERVTEKVLFCLVATRPAVKKLADGRNAHLIVEDYMWWLPKFADRFVVDNFQNLDNGAFMVTCSKKPGVIEIPERKIEVVS